MEQSTLGWIIRSDDTIRNRVQTLIIRDRWKNLTQGLKVTVATDGLMWAIASDDAILAWVAEAMETGDNKGNASACVGDIPDTELLRVIALAKDRVTL